MLKQVAVIATVLSCTTLSGCVARGTSYITQELAEIIPTRRLCSEYGEAYEAASPDLDNIMNELKTRTDISATMCESLIRKARESYIRRMQQ